MLQSALSHRHPDLCLARFDSFQHAFVDPQHQAYAILSDPMQRRKYDRDGHPRAIKGSSRSSGRNRPTPASRAAAAAEAAAPPPAPAPAARESAAAATAAAAAAASAAAAAASAPVPAHMPASAAFSPHDVNQRMSGNWGAGSESWQGSQAGGFTPEWVSYHNNGCSSLFSP